MLDTPQTIPIDTLLPIYHTTLTPELAYQNGDTTLPDIFASYTMELYDVPEVDGFPIAIFSERDDDGPGSGSFTDLVSLDDFTRSASLLARTDSLTQDSTFKVRVYGYMVKGLMAGKMAAQTTNAADDLFNLPPGYSVNNDINDPNCGLPIDAIEDNIFVHCLEFRIGDEQPEIEFSIEISEPKEMWPTIPSTGAPNDFDFSQVESRLEEVIVTLKSGGTPLGNTAINVKAEWITESGGHNHQDTGGSGDLITPPNNIMGYIVNIAEQDSAQGELEALTNEETGGLRLRYNAPEFGGQIALVARYIQETDTLYARDTVNILVPNLILLPEGTSYSKVGGTPSHFGPRVDHRHQDSRAPDNNHYGTQELVDFLIDLSNSWEAIVLADSTEDNRQTPLNINDMSLPNGGKFDIFGRWTGSHFYHRVGRDVDIRTTRNLPIGNNRNGVLLTIVLDTSGDPLLDANNNEIFKNRFFEELLFDLGADQNSGIHGTGLNEHYHIYFYNNN